MGREKVHYQAPDADVLERKMKGFIDWLNPKQGIDPVIKAALAHLIYYCDNYCRNNKSKDGIRLTNFYFKTKLYSQFYCNTI